jgi:class 3 adenylate cyclase
LVIVAAADLQQIAIKRRAKVQEFQRSHRVAVLTLLFTDIVGSTQLKQEFGDQQAVLAIQQHHAAVREVLSRFSQGQEIETAGGFFFYRVHEPFGRSQILALCASSASCIGSGNRSPDI